LHLKKKDKFISIFFEQDSFPVKLKIPPLKRWSQTCSELFISSFFGSTFSKVDIFSKSIFESYKKKLKCFLQTKMNAYNNYIRKKQTNQATMFSAKQSTQSKQIKFNVVVGCKVCKDAGKPESEFSTHFPKDREGKVICPTLLALQCRFCHKPGHTVSHCPTLAAKNKAEEKAKRAAAFANRNENIKPKITNKSKCKFAFDILSDDEETNEEETIVEVAKQVFEEFPALVQTKQKETACEISYASMAAKTVEEFENEQFEKKIRENSLKNFVFSQAQAQAQAATEKKALKRPSVLNWAMEESDSDDEDW